MVSVPLRCAVITEFAREFLAQRGVQVVVPGEKERVVVSLSEEANEAEALSEEKNGAGGPAATVMAGEKCEVRSSDFHFSSYSLKMSLLACLASRSRFDRRHSGLIDRLLIVGVINGDRN